MSSIQMLRIIFGIQCLIISAFVIVFIILQDILMMVATLSIALGLLSLYLTFNAKVEKEKTLQEEIRRKLTMIKEENKSNLNLIEKLIKRREKLYPPELKEKKLKQEDELKYDLTPVEIKQIMEGKVWIQKQHCSYYYAFQVVEIGHNFDDNFIKTVKEYTDKLRDLNSQKDFIQWWIISRGFRLNPDEINNLYKAIDEANEIAKKMRDMIGSEIERRLKDW